MSAVHTLAATASRAARWRPEVIAFADAMEHKLRVNDWKGGWKGDASGRLMNRVREEFREFIAAHLAYPRDTGEYRRRLREEGADVSNMVMMVLDVCGALNAPQAKPAPLPEDIQQIIYALERQARHLQTHADRLCDAQDYSAEFPAEDAQRMREAIDLLRSSALQLDKPKALHTTDCTAVDCDGRCLGAVQPETQR